MIHKVPREKLYEAVWATPMMKVAADYGLTGTGLKKICDRADIPTPPRGYWAKLAHGKKVKTSPLPSGEGTTRMVTIHGYSEGELPSDLQSAKRATLEKIRVLEGSAITPESVSDSPMLATIAGLQEPAHPSARKSPRRSAAPRRTRRAS